MNNQPQRKKKEPLAPTPSKPRRRRNLRRSRVSGAAQPKNACVSLAQPQLRNNNNESIVIKGSDRFAHIADISHYAGQTLIMEIPITAAVFPRLDSISANYQNWQVENLVFRINPQISTNTNGGYIAGYSRDPQEKIGQGFEALNAITSLAGSQTKKWWEDSTVRSVGSVKTLFCQESGENRFYADGTFYLASDGKATTGGAVTVYVDYTVRLLKPVLRKIEPEEEQFEDAPLLLDLYHVWTEGVADVGVLVAIDPATKKVVSMEDALPGIEKYMDAHPDNKLYYGFPKNTPGMKLDGTIEYMYAPHYLFYHGNALDGKPGFVVRPYGYPELSASAAMGMDYSTAQGSNLVFAVPGPRKGSTLRTNAILPAEQESTKKHKNRVGFEHLCIKLTNL